MAPFVIAKNSFMKSVPGGVILSKQEPGTDDDHDERSSGNSQPLFISGRRQSLRQSHVRSQLRLCRRRRGERRRGLRSALVLV